MSVLQPPRPAKLVIGVFMKQKALFAQIAGLLIKEFGAVDIISRWFLFDYTDYYTNEMGSPLFRRMIAFHGFIDQGQLADIKRTANTIEEKFKFDGNRTVNIDAGYLLRERFVLATGKNYAHRIYIGKSVYADLTLIYSGSGYQPLPWTYPDYVAADMHEFLLWTRNRYIRDLPQDQVR